MGRVPGCGGRIDAEGGPLAPPEVGAPQGDAVYVTPTLTRPHPEPVVPRTLGQGPRLGPHTPHGPGPRPTPGRVTPRTVPAPAEEGDRTHTQESRGHSRLQRGDTQGSRRRRTVPRGARHRRDSSSPIADRCHCRGTRRSRRGRAGTSSSTWGWATATGDNGRGGYHSSTHTTPTTAGLDRVQVRGPTPECPTAVPGSSLTGETSVPTRAPTLGGDVSLLEGTRLTGGPAGLEMVDTVHVSPFRRGSRPLSPGPTTTPVRGRTVFRGQPGVGEVRVTLLNPHLPCLDTDRRSPLVAQSQTRRLTDALVTLEHLTNSKGYGRWCLHLVRGP